MWHAYYAVQIDNGGKNAHKKLLILMFYQHGTTWFFIWFKKFAKLHAEWFIIAADSFVSIGGFPMGI